MKIIRVFGREIYDSRGWPTIQCELWLEDGSAFTGYAPASITPSSYEMRELRDGDKRLRGKGGRKAIALIEELVAPSLIGKEPRVPDLDFELLALDGTPDKSHLGSNTLTAVSMALYKAHAHIERVELYEFFAYVVGSESVMLPCPQFSIINNRQKKQDGKAPHGIREYMLAPLGSTTLQEAIQSCFSIYHELHDILRGRGQFMGISDSGGFLVEFDDDHAVLDMLLESIERAAVTEIGPCALALDVSANSLYDPIKNKYLINNQELASGEMVNFYNQLVQMYPIYSIEDGLGEDDWEGWRLIMETLGDKVQIVGDDVFASSCHRLRNTADYNVATAVTIKPSQVGTITETVQMINLCKKYQLNPIISHRSGETEDSFIADLAVGTSCGQIKAGGCSRSERLAKYNRLLAIEEALLLNRSRF